MAKRPNDLRQRYRSPGHWFAAAALGVTLSVCSDSGGIQTTVPRSGAASTSSPSTSAPAASAEVERLVTQRYLDFQRVVAESGATSNANDPRLAEYATGAVLESLRGKLAVRQQAGTRLYGSPVPHVKSVSIVGDRATVLDCLDNSATGLVDRSGKKLSVGRERQETTATLVRTDGSWKVSEITTVAVVLAASPASAEPPGPPVVDDPTGTVTTVIHLPGAPTESNEGVSLNPCSYRYDPSGMVAGGFDFSRADAPSQVQIEAGEVRWYAVSCPGQADYPIFIVQGQPAPGPPPPTPGQLAAAARSVVQLPFPSYGTTPPTPAWSTSTPGCGWTTRAGRSIAARSAWMHRPAVDHAGSVFLILAAGCGRAAAAGVSGFSTLVPVGPCGGWSGQAGWVARGWPGTAGSRRAPTASVRVGGSAVAGRIERAAPGR